MSDDPGYVMVPVPVEIVDEVREYVEWGLTIQNLPLVSPDALLAVLESADDVTRALARVLARNTVETFRSTIGSMADELGISSREVVGIGWELNFAVAKAGGSPFTIVFPTDAMHSDVDRVIAMAVPTAEFLHLHPALR